MDLVLFDLDNTLLSGDSDNFWAAFLADKQLVDPIEHKKRSLEFYTQYCAGSLNITDFCDFQLGPLSLYPRQQLEALRQEFFASRILPCIPNKARELVNEHLASDSIVAIVTATNSFVTQPIARELGIEHLIATIAEQNSAGEFTGRLKGTPAFQAGKITRVNDWLESLGLAWSSFKQSWFYSDSANDLPMLEIVDRPICIDPDNKLAQIARVNNWPVLHIHPQS